MKKLLAFVFVIIMVLSMCPISVYALEDSGMCGENVQWSYDSQNDALIITGTGPMYDYDYSSTTPPWRLRREQIKSIVISDGVTKIGNNAFFYFIRLSSVNIPNGVTTVGKSAFAECESLTNITLPNGLQHIEEKAFAWCENLTQCTLANGIISIGNNSFENCKNLTNITIPDGTTSIGEYAFRGCEKLSSCNLPNSITNIGESAFSGCYALSNITIPGRLATIQSGTFAWCRKLTNIEIPYGVKTIESGAFSYCSELNSVVFSNSVENIDMKAFEGCPNLKQVTIPESVKTLNIDIYSSATINIAPNNPYFLLENGVLFNKSKTILINFPRTKTGNYSIPNTVTEIAKYAFEDSELKSITIPNSVTTIREQAFAGCNVSTLTIPNSVTTIESGAFCSNKNLKSVNLPTSITKISKDLFAGCENLTSITIPNSVTIIEDNAFGGCFNLKSATIPNSVTNIIGDWVFQVCNKLIIYGSRNSCAQNYAKSHNIPFVANDHNHTYGEWSETKPATCTEAGVKNRTCTECAYKETASIDALGHDFQNPITIQESTITTKGIKESSCVRCDEKQQEETSCSYTDNVTGAVFEVEQGVFPDGTEIIIKEINDDSQNYEIVEKSLENTTSQFVAYDISAILDNAETQPNGQVKITLKIPESFSENIGIFFIDDNGEKEELDCNINENQTVTFTTSHFSTYVIGDLNLNNANDNATPKSNTVKYIILIVSLLILISSVVVVFVYIKKKSKK